MLPQIRECIARYCESEGADTYQVTKLISYAGKSEILSSIKEYFDTNHLVQWKIGNDKLKKLCNVGEHLVNLEFLVSSMYDEVRKLLPTNTH